jgi:hypothetical protein
MVIRSIQGQREVAYRMTFAGPASQMHDRLHPDDFAFLSIHHGEREPTAVRSPEGRLEGTSHTWVCRDQPEYSLDLVEEF